MSKQKTRVQLYNNYTAENGNELMLLNVFCKILLDWKLKAYHEVRKEHHVFQI